MAPAADNSNLMLSPQRNVTFAVNYEVSVVDRYWQRNNTTRIGKKQNSSVVDAVQSSTTSVNPNDSAGATRSSTGVNLDSTPNPPLDASALQSPETPKATLTSVSSGPVSDEDSSGSGGSCKENKKKMVSIQSPTQRRSAREKQKRVVPMERTRVRYDMELVPAIKRNRAFLDKFPLWTTPSSKREDKIKALLLKQQALIKQQHKQLQSTKKSQAQKQLQPVAPKKEPQVLVDQKQNEKPLTVSDQQQSALALSSQQQDQQQAKLVAMMETPSDTENMDLQLLQDADDMSPELVPDDNEHPFGEDTSVVWVPKKRSEWEDSVLEMTAVCTSAAMRRHMATRGRSSANKPFHAPLSKEYIRDRVDIDDPLNGYQIRHKTGGWLQGFILWTNFTTWTHYFKWDSSHAMSGIPTMNSGSNKALVDTDGSLAADLESQPRSGDPFEGGVVFEAVAEISLVGGLGCGEYLLRMALESILSKKTYKFVVLQATDTSKTFYERFGFVRVGAICRYERKDRDVGKPGSTPNTPLMGYRHWTHPNESDTSLQKHGGPSYMMCLRLPEYDEDDIIETPFLDAMMNLEVDQKPTIETVGGGSTPHPKIRRASLESAVSSTPQEPQTNTRRKGRRSNNSSPVTETPSLQQKFATNAPSPPVLPILRGSTAPNNPSRNVVCGAASGQQKITLRSSGIKRTVKDDANPSPASTKKRRVSVFGADTKESAGSATAEAGNLNATPKTDGKAPPRRTPRILSSQAAATVPASSAASKSSSTPPTSNPPNPSEPSSSKKKPPAKRSTSRRTAPVPFPAPSTIAPAPPAAAPSSDYSRLGPMKQKVKSYPRDRVHYYNKVVRPKKGKRTENYFVLHYDEGKGTIRIIPMEPRGVLSGKRAGRPRFQAVMTNFERDAKTVRCADYDIVKAFMVMKTPVVASEAWDVLDA